MMNTIGTTSTQSFVKIREVTLQFLSDLTWNDPYASHSVPTTESNYAITNLETLVTHFRYYLYGHNVNFIADHAADNAILGVPNLTGKHARWWCKLYGSGIKKIEIIHRARMNNQHADAFSWQPVLSALPNSEANSEV